MQTATAGQSGRRPRQATKPRDHREQLVALYAEAPSPLVRDAILEVLEQDRLVFVRSIERAMAQMLRKPGAGVVVSDGRIMPEWTHAFDRHPQVWEELRTDILALARETAVDIDRTQYSRAVMLAIRQVR